MASTVYAASPAYDDRSARYRGDSIGAPLGGLFGFCKDSIQGACSGLLALLGATHMTGTPEGFATLHSTVPILDRVWDSISAGGIAGPIELIGGIALYFAARRPIARTLGLLGFIAFVVAYMNGYSLVDMLTGFSGVLDSVVAFLEAAETQNATLRSSVGN